MSSLKFLGTFVQATLFGGTYDDVAFEVRVLKGEVARLHERLDKEMVRLHERLDALEGQPAKGKGRKRLSIMSAAEAADVEPVKVEAAASVPVPSAAPPGAFHGAMSIAEAFEAHPKARDVFAAHHLPGCLDCALSKVESLSTGAQIHSLDAAQLLADLNQLSDL